MQPRPKLTLIHTSDIHIGSERPEESRRGFDAVLQAVRDTSAHALLIAGDLFDSSRAPADEVAYALEALRALHRPVILLPGNHDTLLTAPGAAPVPLPPNTTILRHPQGQTVHFPDLGLHIWGKPVADHTPDFRPLGGLPPRNGHGWFVAMAHGLAADDKYLEGRSSPITYRELADADCDYIALGHVHIFRDLTRGRAPAFYPGSPSESTAPSVAHITLDHEHGVQVQPILFHL
ncbi:MAG: DNA repair exonuclease [SAR202 cluster bacterium]|nr:DNA repair exonuclease [SAR202 cluster bacterium]